MRLRIVTRRSRLAMAQAEEVACHLALLGVEAELVPILSSGDRGEPDAGAPGGVKGAVRGGDREGAPTGHVDLARRVES